MNEKINFYKIYLNCKRGMLELDIVLINFLELEYSNLNETLLKQLNKLLSESDQNLYSWLIKNESCKYDKFTNIIYYIRQSTVRTKFI